MIFERTRPDVATNRSIRILLADDFKDWRAKVKSMLEARPGWKVVGEAKDGIEAVKRASELQPDIILLDIGMPRLNGIDAAKQIRQVSPSSRIIFLSQVNDKEIMEAAQRVNGRAGYVLKTKALIDLIPTITAVSVQIVAQNDQLSFGRKHLSEG